MIGTGWAIHFYSFFKAFGPNTFNSSITLIVIAGIITGALISLIAHKKSYYALSGSILLPLVALYVLTPDADKSVIAYIILFSFLIRTTSR